MKKFFEVDSNGQATRVIQITAADIDAAGIRANIIIPRTITDHMVRDWSKQPLQVVPDPPKTVVINAGDLTEADLVDLVMMADAVTINIAGCGGCPNRGGCVPMVPPPFPPREQWQPPGILYC